MNKSRRVMLTGTVASILMLLLNIYPLTKTTVLTCYEGSNTYNIKQRKAGFPFNFYTSHNGNKCVKNDEMRIISEEASNDGISFSIPTLGFDLAFAGGIALISIIIVERFGSKK